MRRKKISWLHTGWKDSRSKDCAIIVKFVNSDRRNAVLSARRALKGTRLTITEDLTFLNLKLLNRARQHPNVKNVWSWNGTIWYVKEDGVKRRLELFQAI